MTEEVTKSSEIEGKNLPADQVRSSIARRLGIETAGTIPASAQPVIVVVRQKRKARNWMFA